jgi:hypothetical protein
MKNQNRSLSLEPVVQKAKKAISKYVEASIQDMQQKEMVVKDLAGEKSLFYFCYASLFTDNKNEFISRINLAGYFYYRYIIVTDRLKDKANDPEKTMVLKFLTDYYHDESIRLLTQIFKSSTQFWFFWARRKAEYLSTFQLNQKFLTGLSELDFLSLSDNKSANGKVAIDSLFVRDIINKHEHETLLLSHKWFSCGCQYYDDVMDLKEDITNRQTNIALVELRRTMTPAEFLHGLEDPDKMQKLLHIRGVAAELLKKAISCFDEASDIVKSSSCSLWKQVIENRKREVIGVLRNVEFYIGALEKRTSLPIGKIKLTGCLNEDIDKAISLGIDFIASKQEGNGVWRDCPVNTWLSGYWTTGFVLNSLADCNEKVRDKIDINQSINYMQQREGQGWPYVHGSIEDCNSTNFALLGLIANRQMVLKELIELMKYQQQDGGFASYNEAKVLLTFLNDPKITTAKGWIQSHVCVSAGALLVLTKFPAQFQKQRQNLIRFLINNYRKNGDWESYWWTSSIYSTSLIIEAAQVISDNELDLVVGDAIRNMLQRQQENDLFADDFSNKHIFYSAMVLNALSSGSSILDYYQDQMAALSRAILKEQNSDGSWDSCYAMRIPGVDCISPKEVPGWRKSDLGENVIIEDINRIITTSSVIGALTRYEKRTSGR